MEIIELLNDHIEDELEDACTYARLALEYKERDPDVAKLFWELSNEEVSHMDRLHKAVVTKIDQYRREHGEAPAGMTALYDYLHRRQMDKAGKVAALQGRYKR